MNKKIIIIVILAGIISGSPVFSQEGGGGGEQHQVNLLLGNGMFYVSPTTYMAMPVGGKLAAPAGGAHAQLKLTDPNNNSLLNMMGIEYKFRLSDELSFSFSGAGYVSSTPWQDAVDGVTDPLDENYWLIPKYEPIEAELLSRFVGNLGAQYYILGNDKVRPYAGAQFTLQLARIKAEMPYYGAGLDDEEMLMDSRNMGMRCGQTLGVSPSLVAGIEYNLAQNLVIGVEFKAFSYYYSRVKLSPQAGLEDRMYATKEFNFLAQPIFKIGFTF